MIASPVFLKESMNTLINNVRILGQNFCFQTEDNLFSPKKLDEGTKFLLESVSLSKTVTTILDYGCGWGAIGLVLAKINPNLQVVLVDDDPVAIKTVKANIILNNIRNVRVIPTSALGEAIKFSAVFTNPPWHKNKTVIPALIQKSFDLLEPSGSFYMVISKQFNTQNLMQRTFGNVATLAKNSSYKILCSQKKN